VAQHSCRLDDDPIGDASDRFSLMGWCQNPAGLSPQEIAARSRLATILVGEGSDSIKQFDREGQYRAAFHEVAALADADQTAVRNDSIRPILSIGDDEPTTPTVDQAIDSLYQTTSGEDHGLVDGVVNATRDLVAADPSGSGSLPRVAILVNHTMTGNEHTDIEHAVDMARRAGVVLLGYSDGYGDPDEIGYLDRLFRRTGGFYKPLDLSGHAMRDDYRSLKDDRFDDGSDTDGDGLTDCVERRGAPISYGFYVPPPHGVFGSSLQAGGSVVTDADDPDTDHDSLVDGAEMGERIDVPDLDRPDLVDLLQPYIRAGMTFFYNPTSDATRQDGEGDLLDDGLEAQIGTDPLDWDTDHDTISDSDEYWSGGLLDPTTPEDALDSTIPDLVAGTLVVPESWGYWRGDPGAAYPPPTHPEYLTLLWDPHDTSDENDDDCDLASSGCSDVRNYAQQLYEDRGSGTWYDVKCGLTHCQPQDIESGLLRDLVAQQGFFTADGQLTEQKAAELYLQSCLAYAADVRDCSIPAVEAYAADHHPDNWDDLNQAIEAFVGNVPGGTRGAPDQAVIDAYRARVQVYVDEAVANVPRLPGESPNRWGIRVHAELRRLIENAGETDIFAEVSYLNGEPGGAYLKGSSRPDVVIGPNPREPRLILDLKTGAAGVRASWYQRLVQNLPGNFKNVPVQTIRPSPPPD
jgi:hypothetical protein